MKVRVTQALSDMIKKHLLYYGTAYMNFDMQWPEIGTYKMKFFPFYFDFHWFNLRTDPFLVDVDSFAFNFTQMRHNDDDVVYFRVPLVKKWQVYFDYDFWYIFHFVGSMSIEFNKLDALVAFKLQATEHGHLYPQIDSVKINISNSILHHQNWFIQWSFR